MLGRLRIQRPGAPLDVRVDPQHGLGLQRDQERRGVHRYRLRGFVVVYA